MNRFLILMLVACLVSCQRSAHSRHEPPRSIRTQKQAKQSRAHNHSDKSSSFGELAFPKEWVTGLPVPLSKVSVPELQEQVRQLKAQLELILQTEGTQALARYLRVRAVQGLSLGPLRELFYHEHGFKPEWITVSIPTDGLDMVRFANSQLKESGIDFLQFKGVINKQLPPLDQPRPSQATLYHRWEMARSISMPLIGFAITILEAGAKVSSAELITSIVRSFTVLALDLQFKLFGSYWNKFVSQKKSPVTQKMKNAGDKLHRLTDAMNSLLNSAKGMSRAFLYSYIANWGYALLLYVSQSLTLKYLMPGTQKFSILEMINESWLVNTAYFVAFGLIEKTLKTSEDRGEISEMLRFQLESVAIAWASFWRVVSIIPRMRVIGQVMLYSFGAIITIPFVTKTWSAKYYSQETAHIYANNDGVEMPLTKMGDLFGNLYDYPPLSRKISFSELFTKLRQQWMSDLERQR